VAKKIDKKIIELAKKIQGDPVLLELFDHLVKDPALVSIFLKQAKIWQGVS
jgi:hypothetical protein